MGRRRSPFGSVNGVTMSSVSSVSKPKPSAASLRGTFTLSRPIWALPAAILLLVFFVLPLAQNGVRSFADDQAVGDPLFYYRKIILDPYYRSILYDTLSLSLFVTLGCVVLSYPIALYLVRYAGRWRPVILFSLIAPLLTSVIMRTVGIQLLLARKGAVNALLAALHLPALPSNLSSGVPAVYIGMLQALIPFMVLAIVPSIQRIDRSIEESAQVLGAARHIVFLTVTLPLSREGILTGCILVFMMANGSFVTQLLLGGGKLVTISVLIFQQFNVTQDTPFAGAMGNVLLVLCLACLALQFFLVAKGDRR